MRHKGMKSPRDNPRRRARVSTPPAEQYSLFAATVRMPDEDARHFERQALLCQRLLAGLHQPELVELLGRLHEEFEAKAGHRGDAGDIGTAPIGADDMAGDLPAG